MDQEGAEGNGLLHVRDPFGRFRRDPLESGQRLANGYQLPFDAGLQQGMDQVRVEILSSYEPLDLSARLVVILEI